LQQLLRFCYSYYSAGVSGAGVSVAGADSVCPPTGKAGTADAGFFSRISFALTFFALLVEIAAVAAMLNNIITAARIQVDFSRMSAACLTPNVVLPAPKLEASPPPFEFCSKTAMVISTLAITIITTKNPYISICIFLHFVYKGCKVSTFLRI